MYVDGTQGCHGKKLVRQDAPKRHHADEVRCGGAHGIDGLGVHALGLEHGKAKIESARLHRRGLELLAARSHGIGARHHEHHVVGGGNGLERRHRKLGGAHEDDAHASPPRPPRRQGARRRRARPGTQTSRARALRATGGQSWSRRAGGLSRAAGTRQGGYPPPRTAEGHH